MKTTAQKKTRVKPVGPASTRTDEVKFEGREREYVYAVAMKYLKDEEEAADVAQDAMLNAYRHRASFRGDSRFTTWLYRVAATTALMHLRKKRRSRSLSAGWTHWGTSMARSSACASRMASPSRKLPTSCT